METSELVSSLALMTLILGVLFAIIGYVLFKRKRANRHPMQQRGDGVIATMREQDPR